MCWQCAVTTTVFTEKAVVECEGDGSAGTLVAYFYGGFSYELTAEKLDRLRLSVSETPCSEVA